MNIFRYGMLTRSGKPLRSIQKKDDESPCHFETAPFPQWDSCGNGGFFD
ncbi:MAG: hypothetical protein KAU06_09680 [Candidatus Marinimicrobia bacterium]|nr:hypothetical protein [Candidatus Neomarinimicrobiota bacterium]